MDFLVWFVIREEEKWYVGSWLGGFQLPIVVRVDAIAYCKTSS